MPKKLTRISLPPRFGDRVERLVGVGHKMDQVLELQRALLFRNAWIAEHVQRAIDRRDHAIALTLNLPAIALARVVPLARRDIDEMPARGLRLERTDVVGVVRDAAHPRAVQQAIDLAARRGREQGFRDIGNDLVTVVLPAERGRRRQNSQQGNGEQATEQHAGGTVRICDRTHRTASIFRGLLCYARRVFNLNTFEYPLGVWLIRPGCVGQATVRCYERFLCIPRMTFIFALG